jgi:hypothetical protein
MPKDLNTLVVETVVNLTGDNPAVVVSIDDVVRALPRQNEEWVRTAIEVAITAGWLRSPRPEHVQLGSG